MGPVCLDTKDCSELLIRRTSLLGRGGRCGVRGRGKVGNERGGLRKCRKQRAAYVRRSSPMFPTSGWQCRNLTRSRFGWKARLAMDRDMKTWPRWLRSTLWIDAGRLASPDRSAGRMKGQWMRDRLRCLRFVSACRSAGNCKQLEHVSFLKL